MRLRFTSLVVGLLGALLAGLSLGLWACGGQSPSEAVQLPTSSTTVAPAPTASSLEDLWTAGLDALAALGPTRVLMVQTVEGRIEGPEVSPEESTFGPEIEEAEQLLDTANGRARLIVHGLDGSTETIVAVGREQISTRIDSPGAGAFVSTSRYVSQEPPIGLPMALWAGNAVNTSSSGPMQGYADLLGRIEAIVDTGAQVPEGAVEQRPDGSAFLSWTGEGNGMTTTVIVELNTGRLPVSLQTKSRGTPTEGELQGMNYFEYSLSIEYQYEKAAAFADSDFPREVPANTNWEDVTYELALDRPWSEQADWGQYWLGAQVGEWSLTRAEYAIHGRGADVGSGPEPGDEGILLSYRSPQSADPNESMWMMVMPLRGRQFDVMRSCQEEAVSSGRSVRQEMALAGRPATVYSDTLEAGALQGPSTDYLDKLAAAVPGGADGRMNNLSIFLPDAVVSIGVWARIDPQLVLEALSPVQ